MATDESANGYQGGRVPEPKTGAGTQGQDIEKKAKLFTDAVNQVICIGLDKMFKEFWDDLANGR